ncbi:ammonium transporter [Holophaga foetida]|uniref:ammonium transporter n=1 Tax=Holophaga foetida TaxID=35839 RepID=UPI000247378A|nr:ammonium transporter [Holophaga foetida]
MNTAPSPGRRLIRLLPLLLLAAAPAMAQGSDPVPVNDSGATAWMLTSTTLVLLMVPGLAMFYGGLVRTKNVLGTMMHSFASMAIVGVLWAVVGYSLSFGPNALGGLIGWSKGLVLLRSIDHTIMSTGVPEYVFAMFQGKFAIITPALIAGAVAERISFKGWMAFITLWILFVYTPLCHWVWASDGFFFNMGAKGAIDFAGGTVVHISSGVSGLALALYLGARHGYPKAAMSPNNLVMTLMGAGLLWVGWFGFNAGSSIASNLDTARALCVTQVSAAAGALTWVLIETLRDERPTSLGMASGILAGLVVITPAAGVVQVGGAICLGIIASCACYAMIQLKNKLGYDDSLDAFGVHGTGGIIGAIGLVFFIRDSWWVEAGQKVAGWGVMKQLMVQLTAVGTTILFSVVMTLIIAFIVNKTIGLRVTESVEKTGLDHDIHGERGYGLANLN